ncbi:hypothetical protein [Actibacterium sp. D379-3]
MTRTPLIPALGAALCLTLTATGALADGISRSSTIQGSNGRGVTRDSTGSYDAATGTYTSSGTATTNSGQTVTHNSTTTCATTGTGGASCEKSATASGANNSVSSTTQRSYADGTGTKTVTTEGSNGRSVNRTRWLSVNP